MVMDRHGDNSLLCFEEDATNLIAKCYARRYTLRASKFDGCAYLNSQSLTDPSRIASAAYVDSD